MTSKPLYEFDEESQKRIIRAQLAKSGVVEVTGPTEGKYGAVYSIQFAPNIFPNRIAAKSPRIRSFESPNEARRSIEHLLHEIEKTHRIFMIPWINRFTDFELIQGWPFVFSEYRDGTLEDLIANPLAWSSQDKIISLIQIIRGLRMACDKGISAHQDLKPGNIFFDDLSRFNRGIPKQARCMHFRMFIGDFGLADAYREFGHASGSRPYMAPEQFMSKSFDPSAVPTFDVFALGVITFELFTDGRHPIGVTTSDVWPRRAGVSQKWNRESTWRDWAAATDKVRQIENESLPEELRDLVIASLSADSLVRPTLQEFEDGLWRTLRNLDPQTYTNFCAQIVPMEMFSSSDVGWPHMDERLMELRKFYSAL